MATQLDGEGLQVSGVGRHQPAGHHGQVQFVDIEVADRSRQVAQPLQSRLPPVGHVLR